jgi:hypothetical protein
MNPYVKVLILALAGAGTWVATAEQSSASVFAANDLIWDASSTQGNMTLTGKYKESMEHGMVEQSLEAEFEHLRPGTRVTFSLDGINVRTVSADASGVARARLFKLGTPGSDGRPTGPRINDGSILTATVGANSMSATFIPRP